jgi:hypothetical protein
MEWITTTTVIAVPQEGKQIVNAVMAHMDMSALLGMPASEEAIPYDKAFAAVLASLGLYRIPESAMLPALDPASCAIATNETYGLSESNPVILFHYPQYDIERIDEYLGLMTGPDGQSVQRAGEEESSGEFSMEFQIGEDETEDDWLVRQVTVTYEGLATPVTLYLVMLVPGLDDEVTQPEIPAVFSCK